MEYYIWLQSVLGFGNGKTLAVLEHFSCCSAVYNADRKALEDSHLFTKRELSLALNKDLSKAKKIIDDCNNNGIKIITPDDSLYPQRLLCLADMPLVLYSKGNFPNLNDYPSVCIVGPRKATEFGIKSAYSLSARLNCGGIITVSGIAVGIDSAVHEGALFAEGKTVAILPCGHNYSYLSATEELRECIVKSGALISEYPPYYPLKRGAFQIRNRLLSGISLGTVIIEAGEKSGALITARHAYEQGRDVFVLPGNPTEPQYFGSNRLLQDGAKPLLSANDVFNEYISAFGDKINIKRAFAQKIIYNPNIVCKDKVQNKKTVTSKRKIASDSEKSVNIGVQKTVSVPDLSVLSDTAKTIFLSVKSEEFCVDDVVFGNSVADTMSSLTELELYGFIRAVPGGRFQKIK